MTIGSDGVFNKARLAKQEHEISEILEKLEFEKVDLVLKKQGEIPTTKEYINYLIEKDMMDDIEEVDEDTYYITVEPYVFLVEKEVDKNIKITYILHQDNTQEKLVRMIRLNKTSVEIQKGKEEKLTANIFPKNATNQDIIWSSSNEQVAKVDNAGKVTALEEGEAIITATAVDESKVTTSCKVIVWENIPFTWEELSQIAKIISDDSSITWQTESVPITFNEKNTTLQVGHTKKLDGKTVRILGFNHDELTTIQQTDEKGNAIEKNQYGEGATNTKAGITFEYVDFLTSAPMNSSNTNSGGWASSSMKNTTLSRELDNISIKNIIKEVKKEYISIYSDANSKKISNDKLWLLSCGEIWDNGYYGGESRGRAAAMEGKQYKYYQKVVGSTRFNVACNTTKKPSVSSPQGWHLRSPRKLDSECFCYVYTDGTSIVCWASESKGVVPGFCI